MQNYYLYVGKLWVRPSTWEATQSQAQAPGLQGRFVGHCIGAVWSMQGTDPNAIPWFCFQHFQSPHFHSTAPPCAFIWSFIGISQKQALLSRDCAPSTCLSSQKKQVPSLPLQDPAALRTWGGIGGSPRGSQHGEVSRPDAARSWKEFVPIFQSKQHLPSIPQTNYYSTFSF